MDGRHGYYLSMINLIGCRHVIHQGLPPATLEAHVAACISDLLYSCFWDHNGTIL